MTTPPDNLRSASRPSPTDQTSELRGRVGAQSDRFTIDGSPEFERRLEGLCAEVLAGLKRSLPKGRLEALVLGGGYGRGEGGILRGAESDLPYNDLEFYVFLRGSKSLNELRFGRELHALEQNLSRAAGIEVELKLDSLATLRRRTVSMFSYDLVSRHRTIFGGEDVFLGCEHHLDASQIPLSEATRLLLNRCSGLLLVRDLLNGLVAAEKSEGVEKIEPEAADFIGRNLAKMRLGLGDSLLAAVGQYHWSCRTRKELLQSMSPSRELPWLKQVQELHSLGVDFKLHPARQTGSVESFLQQHQELSALAREVWVWVENHRQDDACLPAAALPQAQSRNAVGSVAWMNRLRHLRLFGLKGIWASSAGGYPRERLLRSLPLLLWAGDPARKPEVAGYLQRQLLTSAEDWPGLLAGYKRIWVHYR